MNKIIDIMSKLKSEFVFISKNECFDEYMLDSLDIIHLISLLEESFQIDIDPKDIVPENFKSIQSLEKLVEKSSKH